LGVAFGLMVFIGLPKPSCWSGWGHALFHDLRPAKTEGDMENQKKESRLDGKWRVVRKFIAGDAGGKSLTLYEDYFVEFAAGDTLIETHDDEVTTTSYCFDPGSGTIDVQPITRSQPSPISDAGSAIFRVVPLNDREMYLRKPHSVEASGEFETILLERHLF
jgi:hypothetical protein